MKNDEEIVAAYARVSTDSENQASSFRNQSNYFETAIKEKGKKFYKLYSDKGLSGVYWKKRDGFNQMLRDAGIDVVEKYDYKTKKNEIQYIDSGRKPKFNRIWIKNSARFARNILSWEIIRLLRKKKVYILFLNNNIDTADESKDLTLQIQMAMDENESRVKSEAVKWGYQRGKEAGKVYTHPKITGYDYIKSENRLVKNKDAKAVKLIFELCVNENMGVRRIINELQARGIKSPSGGNRWGNSTIKHILHQEKYYGVNNPLRIEHGSFGEKTWPHRKEEYDLLETDRIEPIITKELFEKAQEKLNERTITMGGNKRGTKHSYSRYSKKIVCGGCGSFYIRNTDYKDTAKTIKYSFFNCNKKRKLGVYVCDNPNILEEELDNLVREFTYGKKINEELTIRKSTYSYMILSVVENELDDINSENDEKAKKLETQINEKREKAELYFRRLVENPELDRHGIFQKMIDDINKELDELQHEYDEVISINSSIYNEVFLLLDEYKKIQNMTQDLKTRYSEEEILDMIDKFYIYTSCDTEKRCDVQITFTLYRESSELLKKYENKYNFKVETFEQYKIDKIESLNNEINTLYKKIRSRLEGVYEL